MIYFFTIKLLIVQISITAQVNLVPPTTLQKSLRKPLIYDYSTSTEPSIILHIIRKDVCRL